MGYRGRKEAIILFKDKKEENEEILFFSHRHKKAPLRYFKLESFGGSGKR